MDIINKINIQLSKIKSILVKELKQGEYTYDYKICEDECKFLDKPELQSYLSETQISNTFFLKIINELCSYIIDIWNDDFQKLDRKMLKEGPHPLYKGMHKIRISLLDFHGLDVFEDEIIHYNTISEKITFAVKYNILDNALLYINIKLIADRCSIILDLITAAYPETFPNNLKSKVPGLTYEEKRDHIINFYEHRLDEIYKIKDDKINSLDYTHLIEQIRLAKQVVLKGKKLQPTNIKLRFKDLFKDNESYNESYNKAVNILKENGYVKQSNNILEWIFTPKTGNTIIQTIVALCVVLEKKQYFKPKLKTIYNNINNEFGISMNKSTYSRSSRAFKRDYNNLTKGTKSYDYISLFKNIL